MSSRKKLISDLEKLSQQFISPQKRAALLESLKGERSKWHSWSAQINGILKNLNEVEAMKFSGLVMLMEQAPEIKFYQEKLEKYLIGRAAYYKYYDFEEKKSQTDDKTKELWLNKIFRCLISPSFVGILVILLFLGFILWFYLDRESCLRFAEMIAQPFLKAIK
jgi:hypothetical protein